MLDQNEIEQISQAVEGKIKNNNQAMRQELGEVLEQNLMPILDEMRKDMDKRFDSVEHRLGILERKVDKAFIDGLDRHEKWIKQIAAKLGIVLEA